MLRLMNILAAEAPVAQVEADTVVVGVYEGGELTRSAAEIDGATGGAVRRLLEAEEIKGKRDELVPLLAPAGVTALGVLLVGLGKRDELDRGSSFRAASAASRHLAGRQRRRVGFYLDDSWAADVVASALCGALVGCHGQDLYRSEKKLFPPGELVWSGGGPETIESGRVLGEAVNLTRRLVNEPAQEAHPESLARTAGEVAASSGLGVEVWDQQRLDSERCGALLAVARGSARPPRLVILRHQGGDPHDQPLALAGKGVTFDSGGLSLKPTDGMKTMKCDMAGAATVLGAMQAVAQLKLPVNVVGLLGLVENMPGPNAYKLGDVLTARSGKTIEVQNTDAEGRLVLADVLSVARDQQPSRIVDLATLTGACIVALGMDVAGLMTNDQPWCDLVRQAARTCGEPCWQLPMFGEYGQQIKSDVADIRNVGEGRWAGAITAAKFLEEFVNGTPWVHIDIAGPSFLEKPKPWLDGGGTGAFVRTLVELARGMGPSAP
jgi:leucyl aminopeptidase